MILAQHAEEVREKKAAARLDKATRQYQDNVKKLKVPLKAKHKRFAKLHDPVQETLDAVSNTLDTLITQQKDNAVIKPNNFEENQSKIEMASALKKKIDACQAVRKACEAILTHCELYQTQYDDACKNDYHQTDPVMLAHAVDVLNKMPDLYQSKEHELRVQLKLAHSQMESVLNKQAIQSNDDKEMRSEDTSDEIKITEPLSNDEDKGMLEEAVLPIALPKTRSYEEMPESSRIEANHASFFHQKTSNNNNNNDFTGLTPYQKNTENQLDYPGQVKPKKKRRIIHEETSIQLGWMQKPIARLIDQLVTHANDKLGDFNDYPLIGKYSLLYSLHELQLFQLVAYSYHKKDKSHEQDPINIPPLFCKSKVGGFANRFWNLLMHRYYQVETQDLLACVKTAYCEKVSVNGDASYKVKMIHEGIERDVANTNLYIKLSESSPERDLLTLIQALKQAFEDLISIKEFVTDQKDPDRISSRSICQPI